MKNSESKWGAYNIYSENMQGNYCPETGEYYLARHEATGDNPVLATYWVDKDGYCHMFALRGYSYEVVRELLQLGHLTPKTLEQFQQEGGEIWWDQP